MQFDIDKMAAMDRYELLLGTVVPRPIAIVTTMASDGTINAAPYSLFNVMGHDPAVASIPSNDSKIPPIISWQPRSSF